MPGLARSQDQRQGLQCAVQCEPGQHAQLLGRVAEVYTRAFSRSRDAQDYLEARGLGSKEMWKAFGLGYADGSLLETIPDEGEIVDSLKAVGLLTKDGKEHFRGCVVVPLTHPDFGVMGFYGRRISSKARVKHLFLPGKRRGVLNWQCLKQGADVVLTESVFDALSLWVAGVGEVSCLFGVSSVPVDLLELMERYRTTSVTFCLDGDRAGREAAAARGQELAELHISSRAVLLPEGPGPQRDPGHRRSRGAQGPSRKDGAAGHGRRAVVCRRGSSRWVRGALRGDGLPCDLQVPGHGQPAGFRQGDQGRDLVL